MTAVTFPRRVLSADSTITVASGLTTNLQIAAASMGSSDTYLAFKGLKSGVTTVGSLDYRQQQPTSLLYCDPTESGRATGGGSTSNPNTPSQVAIDWASCGVYDVATRRVMWMGNGANTNISGGYVYNTHAIYDETNDNWSAIRGFRPSNTTTSESGMAHLYGGNAINTVNRTFYKKHINSQSYLQYNLDTNTLGNKVAYTATGFEQSNGDGSFEWIAQRSRMWVRSNRSSNNAPMIWEFNTAMTVATQVYASDTTFTGGAGGAPLIYNSRAFGGLGGVFMGAANAYTIELGATNATNITHINATGNPGLQFPWPNRGHVCRNTADASGFSAGDGWFYMSPDDGHMWFLSSGSPGLGNSGTWTQRGLLPIEIRNKLAADGSFNYVMIPLDRDTSGRYGVIWIIGSNLGSGVARAWLYKP